jgi:DNA repair exonuclease SbcCD ATPase subunit
MLKKANLQNFRKHTALDVVFTEGLNVIRAPNEGGKTTTLEAIAYALFGSKVLRDGLDNTVTWGQPTNSLKVTVEYGDYVITRSKKGAEVLSMGQVFVTGQSEVTAFCEKLIGADGATAANLMFSNQMGLRGVLTNGPKATAQLIEDLGEFDLFDRIIDAAQHKLPLGAATVQADRLQRLTAELEGLAMPTAPDAAAHEANVLALGSSLAAAKEAEATMSEKLGGAREAISRLKQTRMNHASLVGRLAKVEGRLNDLSVERTSVEGQSTLEPRSTADLEEGLRQSQDLTARRRAWAQFQKLPQPDRHGREAMNAEIVRFQADIKHADEAVRQAQTNIKVAKAKLTTSSTCGFCGQDVSQFPEVAKLNAELEAEILSDGRRNAEARESKEAAERGLESVQALFRVEDEILRGVRGIEQYLDRDESVLPAMFTWKGLPPPPPEEAEADYVSMLEEAKRYNDAILRASTKLEMLNRQIHDLEDDRLKLVHELRGLCPVSDEALAQAEAGFKEGEGTLAEARGAITDLQRSIDGAKADFQFAVAMHAAALEKREQLEKQVENTKQEISTLEFNNGLVKKIRAARPVIGNKLWSMVLASVSTVFSQMRGENSIVSKEKDGFTVNGRSVDSLSGSTLDLLGLAIRCALTKTFVPGCQFIVLDEPSASCDASREAAMLGYIAASGFSQVLLVTHSDVSESFANNLITL